MSNANGGHWIRTEKRHRIYARDGWRCIWCMHLVSTAPENHVEPHRLACLDHVLPRERGGSNHESNLVTSCFPCNSARKHRSALEFALSHASGAGSAYDTLNRVITARDTELPRRPKAC